MMKNYDESVEINHNPNWPYIPGHLCRILINGGSGSGKTVLLNWVKINNQMLTKFICTSKICLYQLLINGREKASLGLD